MKNIAIYICGEVSKKCTANGCLRTFNESEDSFERYKEDGSKLVAFNTCNGCEEDVVIMESLLKNLLSILMLLDIHMDQRKGKRIII